MNNVKFFKRELIEISIKDIKHITLVIKPNEEVIQNYMKWDMINLLKKYGINSRRNEANIYDEEYDINFYFPEFYKDSKRNILSEICFVSINCKLAKDKRELLEDIKKIEKHLAEHTIDIYACNLSPVDIKSILKIDDDYSFNLREFLRSIQATQKELADKTGFSVSYISDICRQREDVKQQVSIELLKKIKEAYPLSPYEFLF